MKQRTLYIYIAAFLAILVPAPGRFVYGVIILFELALLTFLGIFLNYFIEKLKMNDFKTFLLMYSLISITILYRQIFALLQPEITLTLGYIFYLPTLSLFLVGFLFSDNTISLKESLLKYVNYVLPFVAFGLLVFLFRDIFGYGTFTFFGKKHQIYEKILFDAQKLGVFDFVATIPGAFFLEGIILYIQVFVKQKFKIIENAEAQK